MAQGVGLSYSRVAKGQFGVPVQEVRVVAFFYSLPGAHPVV